MIIAIAALEIGIALWLLRNMRLLARAPLRLTRGQARLTQARCCAEARAAARARGERVTGAVEAGTASVEALHRALADLSFELSGNARARARHAHRADQVYGSIRQANRGAGGWYQRLLKPRKRDR